MEELPYVITVLPLDPKKDSFSSKGGAGDAPDPLLTTLETSDGGSIKSSIEMSPSRAQFLKEHSASPFAKEFASLDGRLSERRKSSRQGASSWLKKFASPMVSNLMRSQTTGL